MLLRRLFSGAPKHAYESILAESTTPSHVKSFAYISTAPIVLGAASVVSFSSLGIFPAFVAPLAQYTMAYTAGHTIMMCGAQLGLVGALHLEPGYSSTKFTTIQLLGGFGLAFATWMSVYNYLSSGNTSFYHQANLAGLVAMCQLGVFGMDAYTSSVTKRAPLWWGALRRNVTVAVLLSVLGLIFGSYKQFEEGKAKAKQM
mmetsp:Transcript_21467/g.39283  ORF Transcript_21467/g.39283 Transcript_21467/m.39283 type:complete len:201 (-) Transcript_21467:1418-2020(-)